MNNITGTLRVDSFTFPEFYRATLTEGSARIVRPTASSDAGWVGVYAKTGAGEGENAVGGPEETGMPTSTQGGGGAVVTAMVKKVVVVAAGAAALVV